MSVLKQSTCMTSEQTASADEELVIKFWKMLESGPYYLLIISKVKHDLKNELTLLTLS